MSSKVGASGTLLALLVALLVAGCALELPTSGPSATATPSVQSRARPAARNTAVVERGTVAEVVKLVGRVTPAREQELAFSVNGRVKALLAEPGKVVQQNDLLARLDTGDLESRIEAARVQYEMARLKVDEHKAKQEEAMARRPMELEAAAMAVRQAEAALTKAEADLAQVMAGPTAVEKAEAEVRRARQELLKAEANLAQVLAGPSPLEKAEAEVRRARQELEDARYNLILVQKSEVVSKNVRDREYEHNWYEVRYGETKRKYEQGEASKSDLDRDWRNLLLAKERLDSARTQAAQALATAEQRVAQAEEKLRQAEAELRARQAVPGDPERESAEAAVEQARLGLRKAEADLAAKRALPVDPDRQAAELAVEKARLDLEKARADYQDKAKEPSQDLELALLERSVDSAKATLDSLLAQQEGAELRAPFSGRITSVRVKAGDMVNAYQTVVVLSDPEELLVRADAMDADLARLAVGQKATVTLDTMPGTTMIGEVVSMASGASDRGVRVRVDWSRPPQLGALARLSVEVRRKEGVLVVPATAIRTVGRRTFVEYLDGDVRRSANVEVGIAGENQVEIVRGLQEGQVIVLGP